jgi:PKD repeat protein
VWEPFTFTRAGTYEWDLTGSNGNINSLTMTVESVSDDTATVSASVELGDMTQEVTASGTPSEVREQLSQSVAGAFMSTTYLAPPLARSQGRDFTTDSEWTISTGGDTARMRVTGEKTYASLSCKAWEYSINDQTRMEGCVNVEEGLALYFESYDESGTSEFRMELTNFSPG